MKIRFTHVSGLAAFHLSRTNQYKTPIDNKEYLKKFLGVRSRTQQPSQYQGHNNDMKPKQAFYTRVPDKPDSWLPDDR